MKKFLVIALFAACIAHAMQGTGDMEALLTNPDKKFEHIFLEQPLNNRMDMLDYYTAGSKTFTADQLYGSQIRIDSLSDRHVGIGSNSALSADFYLLTPNRNDSIIVKVMNMPVGNGDAAVYFTNLRTNTGFRPVEIRYSDWLTKEAKEVSPGTLQAGIPMVTWSVEADCTNNTLTLINTAIAVPGIEQDVVDKFLPQLRLKWNGKTFEITR